MPCLRRVGASNAFNSPNFVITSLSMEVRMTAEKILGIMALVYCSSCGSGGGSSSSGDVGSACQTMCSHLVGDLGGCGESKASDEKVCIGYCVDSAGDGDSTVSTIRCGSRASTCTQWEACGELL
jgi:hypothetical protein